MKLPQGRLVKPLASFVLLMVAAVVLAFVIAVVGRASGFSLDLSALAAMSVAAVLLMAGALWVGAIWMRSIDEAAQEAHKSAWYWGGCAGMCIGGVAVILAHLPQAETWRMPSWIPGRLDAVAYAATGAMMMLLLMIAGYLVVWAWWWLARMRS